MNEQERRPPGLDQDDQWVLHTTGREPWLRGYLGNGRLAMQLVADGGLAGAHGTPLHLMAELYDRAEDREVEHPVPLPGWSSLAVRVDRTIPLRPDEAIAYSQTLNLRHGLATTWHTWLVDEAHIAIITTHAVLRHEPNLALIRMQVQSDRDCEISLDLPGLQIPSTNENRVEPTAVGAVPAIGDPLAGVQSQVPQTLRDVARGQSALPPATWITALTRERGIHVALAMTLIAEDPLDPDLPSGAASGLTVGPMIPMNPITYALRAGLPTHLTFLVAVHSDYTAADPLAAAQADLQRAIDRGPERLLVDHRAAWEQLWGADIVVDGDPEVQRFVRAGLFALLCSIREDVAASISPMGLSSLGYNGHIFWDADTWMFPPLQLLHPDLARGMLTYRQRRLHAAEARAHAEGYDGAMFPWESATDGSETTPSFARTGLKEHHITACVALAQWQQYLATGDRAWLADRGWPVIEAAARFWVSRVTANGTGSYEIHDVIAADEYAEDVNNDAFTNAAARAALSAAVAAARELARPAPPEWQRVADGLVLPRDGELVLEFDDYAGRMIKQADVELLTFPLEHPLSAGSIQANLDTYRRATDPEGPAMGRSISAIVSAQLGRREEALALFHQCYRPNVFGPFYALAETPSNGAICFLTGVGGALQTLLFGFAGIRLYHETLALDPLLPEGWQALRFPQLRWRDRALGLAILPGDLAAITLSQAGTRLEIVLQRWRPGDEPLTVAVRGAEGCTCVLQAEDWRVEPEFGVTLNWRLWPPASGPTRPFVRLHLSVQPSHGEPFVFEVEQRVSSGDT